MVRFAEWMTKRFEEPSVRIGFEVERFILLAKEELLRSFEEAGVTQREIAKTLEIKESTVSRALRSTHNMTLRTLCSLAVAAGFRPSITLERLSDAETPWKRSESRSAKLPPLPVRLKPSAASFDRARGEELAA